MAEALSVSVKSRVVFGPRSGLEVRRIGSGFGYAKEIPLVKGVKCASVNGFTLHAQVHFGARQRQRLEQLVEYLARPPLALERRAFAVSHQLDSAHSFATADTFARVLTHDNDERHR